MPGVVSVEQVDADRFLAAMLTGEMISSSMYMLRSWSIVGMMNLSGESGDRGGLGRDDNGGDEVHFLLVLLDVTTETLAVRVPREGAEEERISIRSEAEFSNLPDVAVTVAGKERLSSSKSLQAGTLNDIMGDGLKMLLLLVFCFSCRSSRCLFLFPLLLGSLK